MVSKLFEAISRVRVLSDQRKALGSLLPQKPITNNFPEYLIILGEEFKTESPQKFYVVLCVLPTILWAQFLETSPSSHTSKDSRNYFLSPNIKGCSLAIGCLEWGKHGEDTGEMGERDKIAEGLGGWATGSEDDRSLYIRGK